MSYFKIYRGANQIGGCCSEFCCGDERILIDFGSNLPGTDQESPITDEELKKNVFGGGEKYQAVLFTHYHGDHYGLYKDIPDGIPMYIGKTAKEILSIVTEYVDKNADKKGLGIIEGMGTYDPGHFLQIKNVKNIRVMPLVVDHSALDAYMFYIEMSGKKILYTGDFRDHGIAGEEERLWHLIESERYIPEKIDVLITEGTMLSRIDETKKNVVRTEAELGREAAKRFRERKYNFVLVSSTNLDSIMELYHNTPNDMPFVCDEYQYRIIAKAMQGKKRWLEMYRPKNIGDHKVKQIYVIMRRDEKEIENLIKDNKKNGLYLPFKPVEHPEGHKALMNGFVMLVRQNRYPEKIRENRFEKAIQYFSDLDESQVSIMYSMWEGYLPGSDKEDKDITRLLGDHYKHQLHVSGHAYPETILKLIEKTDPKVIIPMHTEMAAEMKSMDLFSGFNIVDMKDQKNYFDLEKMCMIYERR